MFHISHYLFEYFTNNFVHIGKQIHSSWDSQTQLVEKGNKQQFYYADGISENVFYLSLHIRNWARIFSFHWRIWIKNYAWNLKTKILPEIEVSKFTLKVIYITLLLTFLIHNYQFSLELHEPLNQLQGVLGLLWLISIVREIYILYYNLMIYLNISLLFKLFYFLVQDRKVLLAQSFPKVLLHVLS